MDIFPKLRAAVAGQVELKKGLNEGQITRQEIVDLVKAILMTTPEPYKNDQELRLRLIEDAERDNITWMGSAHTISVSDDGNWEPWLEKKKPNIEWRYWNRYAQLLVEEGWSPRVVDSLGETTDETLSWLNAPETGGNWDRRGMVVGSVQSGKTANYTGLICKAADAGYKVIIVLAGFHNNLRSQTQIRLEDGFLGYYKSESNKRVPTGVGLIAHDDKLLPNTITTRADKGDFNKAVATNFSSSIDRPLIFVIKKNASVLRNVLEYLEGQAAAQKGTHKAARISGIPLLLVDDESDQGSINTNKTNFVSAAEGEDEEFLKETDPTKINGLIRKIINTFEQSAYVAYTATPFANIMIHKDAGSEGFGDDLFPRSFITSIPAPSNYIGPQTMFGFTDQYTGEQTDGLPLTRDVSDYAATDKLKETDGWMPPRHGKDHIPLFEGKKQVPLSLYEAILSYLLACSVRVLRGQGEKHCSMLVHVTRLTNVQHHVMEQVKTVMFQTKQCLVNGRGDSSFTTWGDLERLWGEDFRPTTLAVGDDSCPLHDWQDVREVLPAIVQTVKVREINGTAGDVLDYETHKGKGLNVIAIGGDKLSRGLTLEGLVVSYFTRPSKTYDTLMQMGRWFGYRNGFLDVTRLYAPEVLLKWFRHISDADGELRTDFKTMSAMGATPENFGHRVRTHPLLQITSAVKMREGSKERCSYSGDLVQILVFRAGHNDRQHNLECVEKLVAEVERHAQCESGFREGSILWKGVNPSAITLFLESYKTGYENGLRKVDTNLIAKYINAQTGKRNLTSWTVLVSGSRAGELVSFGSKTVGMIERTDRSKDSSCFKPSVVTSSTDERVIDLDKESMQAALDETRLVVKKSKGAAAAEKVTEPRNVQLRRYRSSKEGLLIIYPIKAPEEHKAASELPFMGMAVSFPRIGEEQDIPVEYIVNSVAQDDYEY
ncbi:Z1 domain-containing protein [Microbulbifer sp. EKSA005]|uniref:Z1 domain-containing protein n=1 Tax=Microbulbifer sp. EKSA005 TaxID=3243364 RepID=UPI0040431EF5